MQNLLQSMKSDSPIDELITHNVVVLCRNSDGFAEFHRSSPKVTHFQFESGEHYTIAKNEASADGYSEPMIAFDIRDTAAYQLSSILFSELSDVLNGPSQTEESRYPKVAVLCRNTEGEAEFHICAPKVTREQVETGEHYDLAKEDAEEHGFDEPMIAFDNSEPAAHQLIEAIHWL